MDFVDEQQRRAPLARGAPARPRKSSSVRRRRNGSPRPGRIRRSPALPISRATVVLPVPGGPQKIIEPRLGAASRRVSAPSGPVRCSCPATSSSVCGRSRSGKAAAARGARTDRNRRSTPPPCHARPAAAPKWSSFRSRHTEAMTQVTRAKANRCWRPRVRMRAVDVVECAPEHERIKQLPPRRRLPRRHARDGARALVEEPGRAHVRVGRGRGGRQGGRRLRRPARGRRRRPAAQAARAARAGRAGAGAGGEARGSRPRR